MSHAETTLTQSALVAIITSPATGVVQLGKVMMKQAFTTHISLRLLIQYLDNRFNQFDILIIRTRLTLGCEILIPNKGLQQCKRKKISTEVRKKESKQSL